MKDIKFKSKLKKNKGITLILLVITVILLLILAGIAFNFAIGENGIFYISQNAKESYKEAQDKEKSDLENLYSSILIATDENAQITVNVEDLKNIIQTQVKEQLEKERKGINQNSLLISSENHSLELGTLGLNSFTNTFTDECSKYFEYDETTGKLTCIQEGEFLVSMGLRMSDYKGGSGWVKNETSFFINDVEVAKVGGEVNETTAQYAHDENTTNVYLKNGDILFFAKNTQRKKEGGANYIGIKIIKM